MASGEPDVGNLIFGFIYEMAMRDAVMRSAFTGASVNMLLGRADAKTGQRPDTMQAERATMARSAVKRYVEWLHNEDSPKSQSEHDHGFIEAAAGVVGAFGCYGDDHDLGTRFTFGNAQKLLNMAVKYLFVTTYGNPGSRGKFEFCHCPMDGVMLDIVTRKVGMMIDEGNTRGELRAFADGCARRRPIKKDWAVRNDLKWSKQDFPTALGNESPYWLYQAAVRTLARDERLIPIEYDYLLWGA